MALAFTPIDPGRHDLATFDCGKSSLNQFLTRYAVRNSKLGLSRSWVLTDNATEGKAAVAAYFTLAASTISRDNLSPQAKSLPAYPVPIVLLARLAVSVHFQRQQLGAKTLVQALRTALALSETGLPALGVVLDVLDDDALRFYQHMGMFESLTEQPTRLFVPMSTIRQL